MLVVTLMNPVEAAFRCARLWSAS